MGKLSRLHVFPPSKARVLLATLLVGSIVVSSCATSPSLSGPTAMEVTELPAQPVPESLRYDNVLVFRGWRFGLPDGWMFRYPANRPGKRSSFTFADRDAEVVGVVDFFSFHENETGLTLTRLLTDLDDSISNDNHSNRWQKLHGPAPGRVVDHGHEYVAYLLSESHVNPTVTAVVVPASSGDESTELGIGFDAIMIQMASQPDLRDRLLELAEEVLANTYYVGLQFDGRYIPRGPHFFVLAPSGDGAAAFHEYASNRWQWITDHPGGFTVHRFIDDTLRQTATIWRAVEAGPAGGNALSTTAPVSDPFRLKFTIGSSVVSAEVTGRFVRRPMTRDSFLFVQGQLSELGYEFMLHRYGIDSSTTEGVPNSPESQIVNMVLDEGVRRLFAFQIELLPVGSEVP